MGARVESLESRMMLTTNIYLNFGQAIGFVDVMLTTMAGIGYTEQRSYSIVADSRLARFP